MTGIMEGGEACRRNRAHTPSAGGNARYRARDGAERSGAESQAQREPDEAAHFNDLGPAKQDPSSFSSISTDLELADLRISSRVIDIDGYGVNAKGSGSVSVSGSDDLNYKA